MRQVLFISSSIVIFISSISYGYSQFIINKKSGSEFDGYETRVYTKPIATGGTRACSYKTILEIDQRGLYFWTYCMFSDRSPYTPIKMFLTINGEKKEIDVPMGFANQSSYNKPPDNYPYPGTAYSVSCQWEKQYDSRISDEFILDLAKATSISVKLVNYAYGPYEDVYFQMSLNPSNTKEALNAFGFYDRAIGHLKEKERKEKDEKERIAKEKKEADERKARANKLATEIDMLMNNDIIVAAKKWNENKSILEYEKIPSTTYDNLRKKLIDYYNSKPISINQYIDDNQIKINADKFKSISDGQYEVIINFNSNKTIPDEFQSITWDFPNFKSDAECCGIKIPCKFNINISSVDSIWSSTDYYSSSKKPIFVKNNKEFFFKSNSGLKTIDFNYNQSIPKGVIKLIKYYKNQKYVNNVLVDEKKYSVQEQLGIIKKEK